MDEWENPNPIMLSEKAAQRSAEEHTEQLTSGQKPMCRRYPCSIYSKYLTPLCGRGLLGRTFLPSCHGTRSGSRPNRRFFGWPIHHLHMEGSNPFTRETGALVVTGGHCEQTKARNDKLRRRRMGTVFIDM